LAALAQMSAETVGSGLVQRWDRLTPETRRTALQLLLNRPERVRTLLDAVSSGKIGRGELDAAQLDFLLHHRDTSIRADAERLFARPPSGSRDEVVKSFLSALQLAGDAARGQKIFQERCVSCHRLNDQGQNLGPDLVTVKTGGKEKVLVNILDPNREVNSTYLSYLVETRRGDSLLGVIAAESASSVTVRQAGGLETTVLRSELTTLQSQGRSLMPEGLEIGLSQQTMADLLEFIMAR
jgi:putative heme-binding domain-containing protein